MLNIHINATTSFNEHLHFQKSGGNNNSFSLSVCLSTSNFVALSVGSVDIKGRRISVLNALCQGQLPRKLLQGISPFDFLELDHHVLVQELVDGEVSTADADLKLALAETDLDSLGSILVLAGGFSLEHKLELVAIGEVVDEVSQLAIHWIVHDRNIDSDLPLEVHAVHLEGVDLLRLVLDLGEERQADLVGLHHAILQLGHVIDRLHHLLLVLHPKPLQLEHLLGERALLLLQRLDLLRLRQDQLSLRLVHLQLLLVGAVRGLQLGLQSGVLVLHIIRRFRPLPVNLKLLSQVLNFRILVRKVVPLTSRLISGIFLSPQLLILELLGGFRSRLERGFRGQGLVPCLRCRELLLLRLVSGHLLMLSGGLGLGPLVVRVELRA